MIDYHLLVKTFSVGNLLISMLLAFFSLMLLAVLVRMSNSAVGETGLMKRIRAMSKAVKLDPLEYFQQYCQRHPDGTYEFSFSRHKTLHKASHLALNGSVVMLGLKVTIIAIIFGMQAGFIGAFSGRTGELYNIFIDSTSGGGQSSSGIYSLQSSFGEELTGNATSSTNFQTNSNLVSIGSEPALGFTVAGGPMNFGMLSPLSTSFSNHTIAGYTSGSHGYDIMLSAEPPRRTDGQTLTAIGGIASSSTPGTEQFGINLAANTAPVFVGAVPVGGHGEASVVYGVPNQYAYQPGDIIAFSDTQSANTIYTVTMMMNISGATAAGSYYGSIVYTIVPRF